KPGALICRRWPMGYVSNQTFQNQKGWQMSEQTQRVAVVTGGARGIGAAVAKRLSADGMAVAVIDLKESDCAATVDAIIAAGGRAVGSRAHVGGSHQGAA